MGTRKRRKFTQEFKEEAARFCKQGDRSIGQVAKDLDLAESALRRWVQQSDVHHSKVPSGACGVECARWNKSVRC